MKNNESPTMRSSCLQQPSPAFEKGEGVLGSYVSDNYAKDRWICQSVEEAIRAQKPDPTANIEVPFAMGDRVRESSPNQA